MRGRLIFPFIVELGLLDTAATAADPDGPSGPLTSGYDDEYREPVIIRPSTGSAPGVLNRQERVEKFFAQIEDDTSEVLNLMASGNSPTSVMGLVFHFADLERAGAVDLSTGKPTIKAPGARLISIRNPKTNELIERFDAKPGLYATQAKSIGFGIGLTRNLLLVVFQERDTSVVGAGG